MRQKVQSRLIDSPGYGFPVKLVHERRGCCFDSRSCHREVLYVRYKNGSGTSIHGLFLFGNKLLGNE